MRSLALLTALLATSSLVAGDGNRLTYLDEVNPYAPSLAFPKLITPQWIGEEGVEAVVVLAIDDMRDTAKYEEYLRPILLRLREIDGRAPVSIMSCKVDPKDPQLQRWLDEGLSIEVHTVDHPCPLLGGGDFEKAKSTYDRCVDLLASIPRNEPVAFRMPCCDSLNTVSPRFYADIFNSRTENGRFLKADSSVFNIFTPDDPELPRELVQDTKGRERFRRYIPRNLERKGKVFDTFVNWIENYPYPYVIGGRCWEFPCTVPSDWEAQHLQQPNNPRTVADMQAALDCTVAKRGVMNLVFHPHGWIRSNQVIELIDHAVEKHGKKVKFLTFREAVERIEKNLLKGQSLRTEQGRFGPVRILDVNADGYMDVVSSAKGAAVTRIWDPKRDRWNECETPFSLTWELKFPVAGEGVEVVPMKQPSEFGVIHTNGHATFAIFGGNPARHEWTIEAWTFGENRWERDRSVPKLPEHTEPDGWGFTMLRDIDGDGLCEWLVPVKERWHRLEMLVLSKNSKGVARKVRWPTPHGGVLPTVPGLDESGVAVRLVDIDEDGALDIVHSGVEEFGVWLWTDWEKGWSRRILHGRREMVIEGDLVLPPIGPALVRGKVRDDNGFFVHSRHLFWQNEDTDTLPDLVDRVSFDALLKDTRPGPKSPEQSPR